MQVKITEAKLNDTDPDTGMQYSLGKGDIVTVPDAQGKRWLSYGWAKDVAGKHPTGERIEGARDVLDVQDAKIEKPKTARGK